MSFILCQVGGPENQGHPLPASPVSRDHPLVPCLSRGLPSCLFILSYTRNLGILFLCLSLPAKCMYPAFFSHMPAKCFIPLFVCLLWVYRDIDLRFYFWCLGCWVYLWMPLDRTRGVLRDHFRHAILFPKWRESRVIFLVTKRRIRENWVPGPCPLILSVHPTTSAFPK